VHYVVLGRHSAEVCPTSNSKTRELLAGIAPKMPEIAEKNRVKIVAGPFVNREHLTVTIAEADRAEDLDHFLLESRLAQWNSVQVLPSLTIQEGMAEFDEQPPMF
jgi:hypothetical protein